jgi:tetratricopeptide (TPR) repeat protein
MASFLDRLTNWATGRGKRHAELVELVAALKAKGQLVEAAAWCERVLRAEPDNGEALLLAAEIAALRGERADAVAALARLQALAPQETATVERMAAAYRRAGAPELALAPLQAALRRAPHSTALFCELGDAEAARGHDAGALAAYDAALAERTSKSRTATQRALVLLRRDWGPPEAAPEKRQGPAARGRIMFSQLGASGRFGAQLAQYMAVRVCAEIHGLSAEVPMWIGRWLFDLDDPLPGAALPELAETDALKSRMFDGANLHLVAARDLAGSFLVNTSLYAPHRALIERLLRPGEKARAALAGVMPQLRTRGDTVIALHFRRTGAMPIGWVLAWLERVWQEAERPVLFLAGEHPETGALARFAPVRAADLGAGVPGAPFFTDFHVFSQADLVASNGLESFIASMLNSRARSFVRRDPAAQALVPYAPWDTPMGPLAAP